MKPSVLSRSNAWVEFFKVIKSQSQLSRNCNILSNGFPKRISVAVLANLHEDLVNVSVTDSEYIIQCNFDFELVQLKCTNCHTYPKDSSLEPKDYIKCPSSLLNDAWVEVVGGKETPMMTTYNDLYKEFTGVFQNQRMNATIGNMITYLNNYNVPYNISYFGDVEFLPNISGFYNIIEPIKLRSKEYYMDVQGSCKKVGSSLLGVDRGHLVFGEEPTSFDETQYRITHKILDNLDSTFSYGLRVEFSGEIDLAIKNKIKEDLSKMVPARSKGVIVV